MKTSNLFAHWSKFSPGETLLMFGLTLVTVGVSFLFVIASAHMITQAPAGTSFAVIDYIGKALLFMTIFALWIAFSIHAMMRVCVRLLDDEFTPVAGDPSYMFYKPLDYLKNLSPHKLHVVRESIWWLAAVIFVLDVVPYVVTKLF